MSARLTDADVEKLLGGKPTWGIGDACDALLARHVIRNLKQSVDQKTMWDICLLAGGFPEDMRAAASKLSKFNARGVSATQLEEMAAKEQA